MDEYPECLSGGQQQRAPIVRALAMPPVCFLDAGVILEHGAPERIFRAPEHPRTQQFLRRIIEAGRL